MWTEIIPGTLAMFVCLSIPGIAIIHLNKYANKGKEERILRNHWQWHLMNRDARVSGTDRHYDSRGLENIK